MNEGLKKVIISWNKWIKHLTSLKERDKYYDTFNNSLASAYIGVRRSGKTTIACLNAIKQSKKICYINFEDPYFITNSDVLHIENIPDLYEEIFGQKPKILIYDEIQNIPYWEKLARKIIDTKSHKLIITGSSAKLLSSEISTSLTGRCLEKIISPLSFKEYLEFQNKNPKHEKEFLKALEGYFYTGGFPKVVLEKNKEKKQKLLEQYLQDIIYRDIIHRYELRDVVSIEKIVQYYFTNISSKHSFNSLQNAFNINIRTVQDYSYHLESAFLFFLVKKYDSNLKVQTRNPYKVYTIDTGLRQANAFYSSQDAGKLMENIVFIELKRRNNKDIYYFQNKQEVDFLIVKNGEPVTAINVTYSNLEKQSLYEREISGMLECMRTHGLKKGIILTKSLEKEELLNGREILFIPVYKFLLEESLI